jgi:hypothetical protein
MQTPRNEYKISNFDPVKLFYQRLKEKIIPFGSRKMTRLCYFWLAIIIGISIVPISCSTSDQVAKPTVESPTIFVPTVTKPLPIKTLKPTNTLVPSNTPEPTEKEPPTPTETRTPIFGPTERLNIQALCMTYSYLTMQSCPIQSDKLEPYTLEEIAFPEPVIFEGAGNNPKLNFYNPFDIALVHIRGNAAGEPFTVRAITPDSHGANLTLVNTMDSYEGFHPIDLYERQHTLRFEISATGDWNIELLPLSNARVIEIPGSLTGSGDDAILIIGGTPGSMTIKGNPDDSIFKVFAYGSVETELVNTKDIFEGKIDLPPDIILLEIQSEGEWEISICEK